MGNVKMLPLVECLGIHTPRVVSSFCSYEEIIKSTYSYDNIRGPAGQYRSTVATWHQGNPERFNGFP